MLFSVCQMSDDLFTGGCHSKSELGPCLAGPPGLFIELYDNSAARPGPPGLDPANTLTEGQTTVLDFFETEIITAFTKIHFLDLGNRAASNVNRSNKWRKLSEFSF